jgi:hypothetical protein
LIEPFVLYEAIVSSFLRELSVWWNYFELSLNAIIFVSDAFWVFKFTISSILNDAETNFSKTGISVVKLADQREE